MTATPFTNPTATWNQRYAAENHLFGQEPNDYLRAQAHHLAPGGRVLCVADGDGRNSVWLARHGFDVSCVDWSETGLQRAQALAAMHAVSIEPICADLASWAWPQGAYDGVVSIHVHLPPTTRPMVHRAMLRALKPGGLLLLEAFDLEQIHYTSGGPNRLDMLYSAEMLAEDFAEGEILTLERAKIVLDEGPYHQGPAEVIRAIVQRTD